MKTTDPNRFLRVSGFVLANPELKIICAVVSDLYFQGYNPRQSLEKNSNLARAAARYKVDAAKIATAVGVELSKAKNKANDIRQPTKKSNTVKLPHPKRS